MSGAKPTLGRIVHYHGVNGTGTEVVTEAAVVIGEYNDPYDAADLLVFGLRRTRRCLGVRQGEAAGQWSWPILVR